MDEKLIENRYVIKATYNNGNRSHHLYYLNLDQNFSDSGEYPGEREIESYYKRAYHSKNGAEKSADQLIIRSSMSSEDILNWNTYTDEKKDEIRQKIYSNNKEYEVMKLKDVFDNWKKREESSAS